MQFAKPVPGMQQTNKPPSTPIAPAKTSATPPRMPSKVPLPVIGDREKDNQLATKRIGDRLLQRLNEGDKKVTYR